MGSGVSKRASQDTQPKTFTISEETTTELSNLLTKQQERRIERETQARKIAAKRKEEQQYLQKKKSLLLEHITKRKTNIENEKIEKRQKRASLQKQLEKENEESKKMYSGAPDTDLEDQRLSALRELQTDVTTPFDASFNKITALAQKHFGASMVFISLVDKYSQWLKASVGLNAKYTCRNLSFCAFTIRKKKPHIILDASKEALYKDNPMVKGPPGLRFYAGALLSTPSGFNVGTFCLADTKPREEFTENDASSLQQFADIAYKEMELHRAANIQRKAKIQQEKIIEFSEKALGFDNLECLIDLSVVTTAETLDFDCIAYLSLNKAPEYKVKGGQNYKFESLSKLGWEKEYEPFAIIQALEPMAIHCLEHHSKYKDNALVIEQDSDNHHLLPSADQVGFHLMCGMATTVFKSKDCAEPHGVLFGFYDMTRNMWREEHPFMVSMSHTLSSLIERTLWSQVLKQERNRSEDLLLNILPQPISLRLKANERPIADGYQLSTVLFADLVGFTTFASKVSPKELVGFLNEIFSAFDRLVSEEYQLEKVKTIGDAYMCAGGLLSHEDDHPQVMLDLAMDMFKVFDEIVSKTYPHMNMRIGINTGPVTAGVIGTHKFLYDLWGDAVNVASRMESSGIPGKIQVSEMTFSLLDHSKYVPEVARKVDVKGKGTMQTFVFKPV